MRVAILCILVALPVGLAADKPRPEAEWPCFHGPERDNKSTETGLLTEWPEDGPKLLWSADGLGKGYSGVAVAGGLIYSAGVNEGRTFVFAFDLDGKPQWRSPNGRAWSTVRPWAARYAGSRATPTYDAGRIYHLADLGRLACLDAATGKERWHRDLLEEFGGRKPKFGLAESVLIDGDRLFACPAGTKAYMVCLDKKTGKTLWTCDEIEGDVGYCSPVIAEFGGFRQVLSMSSEWLFGVDVETGRLLWKVPHRNNRENNATDPIFHKGHVFASSGYRKGCQLVKLTAEGEGEERTVEATQVWSNRRMDNHHGGLVLHEGHVYGAGHVSKGWFCLDLMTGRQRWNADGKGAITYADGMLYLLEEDGRMRLVEATPKEFREAGSFQVPSGGEGKHWAHPVVCGGRLYVRHADKLFAYDVKAE
jgi:outer membrane protein assembly factor BamB